MSVYEAIPAASRKKQKLLDVNSEQTPEKPNDKTASNEKLTPAEKGVEFCNRLFYEERLYKELPADERKKMRLETQPQIWDEFWSWIDTLSPTGGSKLEKAVNYALNHKETLTNYLKAGRCEISNNAAERRVKSYVMGRKKLSVSQQYRRSHSKCNRPKSNRNSKDKQSEYLSLSVHPATVYAGLQK